MEGNEPEGNEPEELDLDPEPSTGGVTGSASSSQPRPMGPRLLGWLAAMIAGLAILCCISFELDPALPFTVALGGPSALIEDVPAAPLNASRPAPAASPDQAPAPPLDLSKYKSDPTWSLPAAPVARAAPAPTPVPTPRRDTLTECSTACGRWWACFADCAKGEAAGGEDGATCLERTCARYPDCVDAGHPECDELMKSAMTRGAH